MIEKWVLEQPKTEISKAQSVERLEYILIKTS
jgi:hypothetical protein